MPVGSLIAGPPNFFKAPVVVILSMELLPKLANHRFLSGPVTMASGRLMPLPLNTVTTPAVVICPMELLP